MSFALGGAAPLASVLGGNSPLTPAVSGVSLLTPVLERNSQAIVDAGETAAMPPPDVVYEPGAPQDGALLTYSPPAATQIAPDAEDAASEPEGDVTAAETQARQASSVAADDAGDEAVAASDSALSIAVAASSSLRTQFASQQAAADSGVATEGPVSIQVARATQILQASHLAPASLPGLASADAAPVAAADPQSQSQVIAQAVYALIADAYVQDRPVTDLIKFA